MTSSSEGNRERDKLVADSIEARRACQSISPRSVPWSRWFGAPFFCTLAGEKQNCGRRVTDWAGGPVSYIETNFILSSYSNTLIIKYYLIVDKLSCDRGA
jgi:hypothetical protein